MGTRTAPSYANLFLAKFETDALSHAPHQPHTWWRFIDDIFMIWTHTEDELSTFITHQTHYEKSDWPRAFNQFTIACETDIINAISAADITFIMSSSTSAWLLSPLECSPQKQNGWTLRFCFLGCGFRMISWIIKTSCLYYLPQPSASADNTDLGFDNSWYHAQPHPIIVYYYLPQQHSPHYQIHFIPFSYIYFFSRHQGLTWPVW